MSEKTLKDLEDDITLILPELKSWVFDKARLSVAASYITLQIQQRVQNGYGVSSMGGTKESFKGLTDYTIHVRSIMRLKGTLSDKTDPETSNQTATGTMIDSLDFELTSEGFNILVTEPTRQEVVVKQEEMGRPWLYLTDEETEIINSHVESGIKEVLGKIFIPK